MAYSHKVELSNGDFVYSTGSWQVNEHAQPSYDVGQAFTGAGNDMWIVGQQANDAGPDHSPGELIYDFTEDVKVSNLYIKNGNNTAQNVGLVQIQYYSDSAWVPVGNPSSTGFASNTNLGELTISFDPAVSRYWRVSVTRHDGAVLNTSVTDIVLGHTGTYTGKF